MATKKRFSLSKLSLLTKVFIVIAIIIGIAAILGGATQTANFYKAGVLKTLGECSNPPTKISCNSFDGNHDACIRQGCSYNTYQACQGTSWLEKEYQVGCRGSRYLYNESMCKEVGCTWKSTTTLTPLCKDSDNGINLNTKGTCSGPEASYYKIDHCSTDGKIVEAYCVPASTSPDATISRNCKEVTMSCPSGQTCSDGKCVSTSARMTYSPM